MKRVMVLDAENRAGLGVLRSLARRDFRVIAGGSRRFSRAFYSKYCGGHFVYPPLSKGMEYVHECVLANVRRHKPDVLMPLFNETFSVVSRYREEYMKYTNIIPMADYETFKKINDKEILIRLARKYGIPTPRTYFPRDLNEVKRISRDIDYPVLVKPRTATGGRGIEYSSCREELIRNYLSVSRLKTVPAGCDYTRPLIQEYIDYPPATVYVLFDRGRLIAMMSKQNFEYYPHPFGSPFSNITIKDKLIEDMAVKFFRKLKWHGAANIHFITDPKDGIPKLLEINPRLWGGVESSVVAGMDFPYLLCKMALHKKIEPQYDYTVGLKFKWVLFGEAYHLLKFKNRRESLRELLNFRGYNSEISMMDMKPHIVQAITLPLYKGVL